MTYTKNGKTYDHIQRQGESHNGWSSDEYRSSRDPGRPHRRGDAAKREMITGIGIHKTTQAANVFSLLNKRGLPTAFIERASPNTLLCHQCKMLPLELVVRRYAWGSYLQRQPDYKRQDGTAYRFDELVWEIFHKWSVVSSPITNSPYQIDEEAARELFLRNGIWHEGVYTDPYLQVENKQWLLYPSKKEISKSKPIMSIEPLS